MKTEHLPENSTLNCPNERLSIETLRPAQSIYSKTSSMFWISFFGVCMATPMSSTYRAHLSALTTKSRYSVTKLINVDREPFRIWARRL